MCEIDSPMKKSIINTVYDFTSREFVTKVVAKDPSWGKNPGGGKGLRSARDSDKGSNVEAGRQLSQL